MPITTLAVSPGARCSETTGLPPRPLHQPTPVPVPPPAALQPCHTDLGELLDPHAGEQLGFADPQALHLGVGVVGDLDLDGQHVGVPQEGPAAEAVLD